MFGHDNNDQQNDDHGQADPVNSPGNLGHDDTATGDAGGVHPTAPVVGSEGLTMGPAPVSSAPSTLPHPAGVSTAGPDDLLSIKQQALQQLSPLVGHLDQPPEEKFRTLMMMIQASDDQSKLKEAYDIAKQITDEKARAQALLDVVNEINYFTQQHKEK